MQRKRLLEEKKELSIDQYMRYSMMMEDRRREERREELLEERRMRREEMAIQKQNMQMMQMMMMGRVVPNPIHHTTPPLPPLPANTIDVLHDEVTSLIQSNSEPKESV